MLCLRSVVEVVQMLLDFMETLEEKLDSVHSCITSRESVSQLVSHMIDQTIRARADGKCSPHMRVVCDIMVDR